MDFIGVEISVDLTEGAGPEKKPPPPRSFRWHETDFEIVEVLAEWHRYGRPEIRTQGGRPPYAQRSGRTQGSWGVGRAYFRVRTADDRLFDLYYDRAPKKQQRSGSWFLWRELADDEIALGMEE